MSITDIPDLVAIDLASQEEPWSESAFLEELDLPHSLVLVARVVEAEPGPTAARNPQPATRIPLEPESEQQSEPTCTAAGYICLWLVAGEAQVLNLAVHPRHRRQGIGSILLTHALGTARQLGAQKAYLEVRKANRAAQLLYQSVGFEISGERPNFYGCGDRREAAVLMALELAAPRVPRRCLTLHTQNHCN